MEGAVVRYLDSPVARSIANLSAILGLVGLVATTAWSLLSSAGVVGILLTVAFAVSAALVLVGAGYYALHYARSRGWLPHDYLEADSGGHVAAGARIPQYNKTANGSGHIGGSAPVGQITQEFVGQPFQNETIVLDGRRYIDCTFRNCTFVWNGGAWEVRHWKRVGQFRWKTSWPPALETINQLKALDILGDPDFAATWAHPDPGTALATVDERRGREGNLTAAERLRMLRAVAVHFLKVGNRLPYLGSTKQQEDIFRARVLAQLGTWEAMVMEIKPETHGADNEWDRFKVLGNMAVPDVIAEKIDRLDALIAKLTQAAPQADGT